MLPHAAPCFPMLPKPLKCFLILPNASPHYLSPLKCFLMLPHTAPALQSIYPGCPSPSEYSPTLPQPLKVFPHAALCCISPLECYPVLTQLFRLLPHVALCCPSPKECLPIMFLPLRLLPFLVILKTVFFNTFGEGAARKYKYFVCTCLTRYFGTCFGPELS